MKIVSKLVGVSGAAALVGAVFGLGGCTTPTQIANLSATQAGADIFLAKGARGTGLGVSASQLYAIGTDGTCKTLKVAADLRALPGKGKNVRFASNAPLYVHASTQYFYTSSVTPNGYGATVGVKTTLCRAAASFVPETGHAYQVQQQSSFGEAGCAVHVTDTTTGAEIKVENLARLSYCRPVRMKNGLAFY